MLLCGGLFRWCVEGLGGRLGRCCLGYVIIAALFFLCGGNVSRRAGVAFNMGAGTR
jgi:hypothetical protein